RDEAGKIVDRSGRSTSPHLVFLDPDAKARYYADIGDETAEPISQSEAVAAGGGFTAAPEPTSEGGWMDAGASRFTKLKGGATVRREGPGRPVRHPVPPLAQGRLRPRGGGVRVDRPGPVRQQRAALPLVLRQAAGARGPRPALRDLGPHLARRRRGGGDRGRRALVPRSARLEGAHQRGRRAAGGAELLGGAGDRRRLRRRRGRREVLTCGAL